MSAITVINRFNSPNDVVLADYIAKASMELYKKRRFDFGQGICKRKMLEILFLDRLICDDKCYLDDEDRRVIRERLLRISILDLDEL